MQKQNKRLLYSASDLVNFLACEHLTTLDLINLDTPLPQSEDSDEAKLIQRKGYAHESNFLEHLKAQYTSVIDIAAAAESLPDKIAATQQAMRQGHDIIFQATLYDEPFIGHADFLRKTNHPSALGDWSYEVLDTKLARSEHGKFVVQLAFYSRLLARTQGTEPLEMRVVLGDRREVSYRYSDYSRYLGGVLARFIDYINNIRKTLIRCPVKSAVFVDGANCANSAVSTTTI